MHKTVEKILITEKEILEKCKELGRKITKDYSDSENLMLVGLLKGSVPFMGDLMKEIDLDLTVEYMDVSSYVETVSTEVKIIKDLDSPVSGKDILIVEDVVDTGKTLHIVIQLLKDRGANSVKVVTMIDKEGNRVVELNADYVGFSIGSEFIVGYGLDFNERLRNLKYIGILKKDLYTK